MGCFRQRGQRVTEMVEAGTLGVFAAIGTVTAHAFWKVSGPERKGDGRIPNALWADRRSCA